MGWFGGDIVADDCPRSGSRSIHKVILRHVRSHPQLSRSSELASPPRRTRSPEQNIYEKLKIKVLTMINDLLIERDDAAKMNDEASVKRRSQYNDIDKKFSIE